MAAPGTAPIQVSLDTVSAGSGTDDLLAALLRVNPRVSDVIFSPGRKFQVQVNGEFVPVAMPGAPSLTADDTRRIASDLIGNNKAAINILREQGYCDISYAIPGLARFRVNVFIQRGSCAVVMRVIPTQVPNFQTLGLPDQLREISSLRQGLVLVTGPRGSGKTSTLAALVDFINETQVCHIITIEDPIEFLHNHKKATVHQRELHSDTPSVEHAMRAALRQVPNVIAVGDLKDREATELALEAAETGHLVLSTLNTATPEQMMERLVAMFSVPGQQAIRERLARIIRYVISQRLLPRKHESGSVAVFEVLKSSSSFDEVLQNRARDSHSNSVAHGFDAQIARLLGDEIISDEVALAHSANSSALAAKLPGHRH